MIKNIEVKKFEFVTRDYVNDTKYVHWSRIYEWKYVIDHISVLNPKSIHNTSCGGLNVNDTLHLTFCEDLDNLCNSTIHSDLWGGGYPGTEVKPNKDNFIFYDIKEKLNKKFDLVLNISTLEHIDKTHIRESINNLIDQVNEGGEMILTFDYPDINISTIEDIFGEKINPNDNHITNGNLKVVLLHLKKIK